MLADSTRERALLEGLYEAPPGSRLREKLMMAVVTNALDVCAPALERVFGGRVASDGTEIVTAEALSPRLLEDLFTNRICAIRVPGFCSPALAARLSAWVLHEGGVSDWPVKNLDGSFTKSDTQYAVGAPLSEGFSSKEKFVDYFTDAVPAIHRLRAAAAPSMSPIDRLRLELDEMWPHGSYVRHHHGRCMFTGIARVMRPETLLDGDRRREGICHVDDFPVTSAEAGVFSINAYLEVPETGGELDIWNISPTRWDCARGYSVFKHFGDSFSAESQRILRAGLPPPITIKPQKGDIILINTGRPHAVRGFEEGLRVTLQTFVSYAKDKPLLLMA